MYTSLSSANMLDNKINMTDIMCDFLSFLSAGMETTAITMSVLMWHVVKNPEIYRQLKDEVCCFLIFRLNSLHLLIEICSTYNKETNLYSISFYLICRHFNPIYAYSL